MKKRIIAIALASIMALGLIACSKEEAKPAEDTTQAQEVQETTTEEEPAAALPAAGVYTSSYEEELDGENYVFNTYIFINGDGTGTWVVQDTCDITYDDSTMSSVYNGEVFESYTYEYKNNSIFLNEGDFTNEYKFTSADVPSDIPAWLDEQNPTADAGVRVEPIPVEVDPENPADGEYQISMESYEDCQDSYGIKGTLYLVEKYDAEAVKALQPGDTVVVDGNDMEVATVDFSGSLILINGGEEEGGVCFRVYDDQPYCQVAGMDDFPTFVECGAINLFVPTDCVITDNSDIMEHPDGIVYTPAEFKKAMSDPTDYWYWNTSVVIKDGDIVEINIRFVP